MPSKLYKEIILVLTLVYFLLMEHALGQATGSSSSQSLGHPQPVDNHENVHNAPYIDPQQVNSDHMHEHKTGNNGTTNSDPVSQDSCHDECHDSLHMIMTFTSSVKVTILFTFWETSSYLELAISCAVVFFMAIVNECLRFFQTQLHIRHLDYLTNTNLPQETSAVATYGSVQTDACSLQIPDKKLAKSNRCASIFVSVAFSLHYMLKEALGVVIMLILMTFNVWVIISILIGQAVGYVITSHMTSWRRRCQKKTSAFE